MKAFSSILLISTLLYFCATVGAQTASSTPIIFTVAGGAFGDGRLATNAGIGDVEGIATDSSGNLYFSDSDNDVVLKVDANGILRTVAGTGTPVGPVDTDGIDHATVLTVTTATGDGGLATEAELNGPTTLAFDGAGNLYILESGSGDEQRDRIRKVDTSGIITTFAGTGTCGYSGDGGPASKAQICTDWGDQYAFQFDNAGNMYFIDIGSDQYTGTRIRKIDTNGTITTVAGTGTPGFSGDGGPATLAQISPADLLVDGSGNLYFTNIANIGSQQDVRIRKVDSSGRITTFAGNGVPGFSGDGGPATSASVDPYYGLYRPAVDSTGNFYFINFSSVTGSYDWRIRRVDTSGIISTFAGNGIMGSTGDGGPAKSAEIAPVDLFFDSGGDLLFINQPATNSYPAPATIRKINSSGVISTIAGNGTAGFSGDGGSATAAEINPEGLILVDAQGTIFFLDIDNSSAWSFHIRAVTSGDIINTIAGNGTNGLSGDGAAAENAQVDNPAGIALDGNGNLYFADLNNGRLREVDSSGTISTIAGNGSYSPPVSGSALNAGLYTPIGVAIDKAGITYFTDGQDCAVYKIDTGGLLSIFAGQPAYFGCGYTGDGGPATSAKLDFPLAVTADNDGNVYIGDSSNFRVRKVDSAGTITTVAGNGTGGFSGDGGLATSAEIGQPAGLAVDDAGNLYIADSDNYRIRKVDSKGVITTYAGTGTPGFAGDNGPAINAEFSGINGLAVDSLGNLYIADGQNERVRMVDTQGTITTFAGSGALGYSGDGGAATSASLSFPGGIAVDSNGALYIGDVFNDRVREVVPAFTLNANSPSINIPSPGSPGTLSLGLTPGARFSGTVSLACAVTFSGSGTPNDMPTCSVSPAPVNITGPGTNNLTLTISTTAPQSAMLHSGGEKNLVAARTGHGPLIMLGLLLWPFVRRRHRTHLLCLILLTVGIGIASVGCGSGGGGGGGGGGTKDPGTTVGSYSVKITATSGSSTCSLSIPITVE